VIEAEAHSDDRVHEVVFDAEPWFDQALDDEILDLVDIGYSHDYAADYVAEYFEDSDPRLSALFEYARRMFNVGFEVVVDSAAAEAWLRTHRPHLGNYLDGEVPKGYRPTHGIGNRIIWQLPQT
jgi:hypothetical protein